jgi:hypothetical protein
MNDSDNKMLVQLSTAELETLIERAVTKALDKQRPAKLLFNTEEAAAMLGVPKTWLAGRARAGEVPHRMLGHYRLFSLEDIQAIMAKFRQ